MKRLKSLNNVLESNTNNSTKKNLKVKLLTETAKLPTYSTIGSAGADLYADITNEITLSSGETKFIHTGLAMAIPKGYVGLVFARSGLGCKHGLIPSNAVGVIDFGYIGEIMVALYNHSNEAYTIQPHERIAQILLMPVKQMNFEVVDKLEDTERGTDGFGSSGRN